MEKELLDKILSKLESIETRVQSVESNVNDLKISHEQMQLDIKDLKEGQERIELKLESLDSKFDDLEPKNATRHSEMLSKIDTLTRDLSLVEAVTGKNMADIAHLKLIK